MISISVYTNDCTFGTNWSALLAAGVLLATLAGAAVADECSEFLDARTRHDEAFNAFLAKTPDLDTAHERLLQAGNEALRATRYAHASIDDVNSRGILDELFSAKEILSSAEIGLSAWFLTIEINKTEKAYLVEHVYGAAGKTHDAYIELLKAACQKESQK